MKYYTNFRDTPLGRTHDSFIYELSIEQRNKLENFLNIFFSDEKYIAELREKMFIDTIFSIENIWITYVVL
jgi:hypothetical protein